MTARSARAALTALVWMLGVQSVAAEPAPVAAVAAPVAPSTQAAPAAADFSTEWLPGDARRITRNTSASRDVGALDVVVYPRFSVTFGTEFGLVRLKKGPVSFVPGVFALFNLESQSKSKQIFPAPGGDSNLWRGILGYELSCSFDRFAERFLGERGALEVAIGYLHESEHHSASNGVLPPGSEPDHPELRGRPQLSNWLAFDLAGRTELAHFELVARGQGKGFVNGPLSQHEPFRYGLSADVIVRSRHHARVQPFLATFGEILHSPITRDANSFRALLGAAFPGTYGELSLFLSLSTGANKGLLIPLHTTDVGGGLRYAPFRS
jgi:hypothetical protein